MHPYRSVGTPIERERRADSGSDDRMLACTLSLLWLLSVARVVVGLVGHETFGTEGTIAFLLVAVLPFALKSSIF